MKKLLKNIKLVLFFAGLVLVVFLANCGLTPLTIEVPSVVNANEVATFILNCGTEPRIANTDPPYTSKLIVGFMVPKSWKAAQNTTVELISSEKGNSTLVLIPSAEKEAASGLAWPDAAKKRFGIGPNLLDDFEWLVYRSVPAYTFINNEDIKFKVKISSKVGSENSFSRLGFFILSAKENLRPEDTDYTKYAFSNNFSVTNGEGDLVDYVNPQLAKVEPVKSLDNDFISLNFDAGIIETTLSNTDEIFLEARGFTKSGQQIAITTKVDKTRLKPLGGKKYRIDIWPRGLLNVPQNETLDRFEYYFTNAAGNAKVGYGNTADPFRYTFKCP
ncbi:DUF4961 domain-containing protein [Desertivirga arenae]|uniref:DUF4961 domain-containing protein n=1 Tax=Desertivirga arenae TaxID=2810309 RepID=UPI001A95DC65|nr:DUF4961 domain-containing protein [Pedobacter sp. SYSU D00823]